MKKFISLIIKIILILIIIATVIWYLFGSDGPLYDKGQLFLQDFNFELALPFQKDKGEDSSAESQGLKPSDTEEVEVEETEPLVEETEEVVDETATIVFTGDVEISTYVQAKYDASGIEGILSPTLLSELQNADVTMINNEFCFSTRGTPADKQYTFRVDPTYSSILTDMGVDVAGLANNHVLDYGKDALTDTFSTLNSVNVDYVGAGNSMEEASKMVVKTDAKGRTYGFMASSHIIPVAGWDIQNSQPGVFTFYDDTKLLEAVKEASSQVDFLFVMVHWGKEHTTELESYQINEGHAIIDAGATAVIGMHSHCLQPMEYYNGHPIFYSLGNFIFNQTITSGAAVAFDFDAHDNMTVRAITVTAEDTYTHESEAEIEER